MATLIGLSFERCRFSQLTVRLRQLGQYARFSWANLVLFAVAALLVFFGIRRAFAPERRRLSKVVASIVATLSVLNIAMFIFVAFVASRWLPASTGAPQVAQKAPEFSLNDTNKIVGREAR